MPNKSSANFYLRKLTIPENQWIKHVPIFEHIKRMPDR